MPTRILESSTVSENWDELLDSIVGGMTNIVITRYGKPVAVMIRYKDYAALQDELLRLRERKLEVNHAMLASEPLLSREWNTPEEDEAWADL